MPGLGFFFVCLLHLIQLMKVLGMTHSSPTFSYNPGKTSYQQVFGPESHEADSGPKSSIPFWRSLKLFIEHCLLAFIGHSKCWSDIVMLEVIPCLLLNKAQIAKTSTSKEELMVKQAVQRSVSQ